MLAQGIAYWASLHKPKVNEKFNINRYEITLHMTDKQAAEVAATGVEVKTATADDNKGFEGKYVVFKENAEKKSGEKNKAIPVVDATKRPIDDQVGNGSKVNVSFYPFEWTFAGKSGVKPTLKAVQVVELVAFNSSGVGEFDNYDSETNPF